MSNFCAKIKTYYIKRHTGNEAEMTAGLFVLYQGENWDGYTFFGIFSSIEKAKEAADTSWGRPLKWQDDEKGSEAEDFYYIRPVIIDEMFRG